MNLEFENVTVEYPLHVPQNQSIKKALMNKIGGVIGRNNGSTFVKALNDITFKLNNGERISILGHNGAGKSTLLKVASGAYAPTSGLVKVSSSRRSLIDIGLGMEGELTGLENISRRLILLGYSKERRKTLTEEIIDFTELEDFITLPIRTYSTGMNIRLAFAIATCEPVDLLIMDEVIGAGDESFRIKINERMSQYITKSGSILLSTHDLDLARKISTSCILLNAGSISMSGDPSAVIDEYRRNC